MEPTEKKQEFSDSTRALLEMLAKEQQHREWQSKKRKARFEAVRGWITWLTAAWGLKVIIWDNIVLFWRDHLK